MKFPTWKNSTPQIFFAILHMHSAFAAEKVFALKKSGNRICFWDISFANKEFPRAFHAQIKISTLQDHTLRTREDGPLISKARNSTQINTNSPRIVFPLLRLLLEA